MTRPLVGLAIPCVVLGVLPIVVVPPALRVGSLIAGSALGAAGPRVPVVAATAFTTLLAGTLAIAWAVYGARAVARRVRPVVAATWGCGYALPTPRMEYTASSFAASLVGTFRSFVGVRTHQTPQAFSTRAFDPVLDQVVLRGWRGVQAAATRLRSMQRGALSFYLLYVVATVVVLLFYLVAGSDR